LINVKEKKISVVDKNKRNALKRAGSFLVFSPLLFINNGALAVTNTESCKKYSVVDPKNCTTCLLCLKACPVGAITYNYGLKQIEISQSKCKGDRCHLNEPEPPCKAVCPQDDFPIIDCADK